MDALKAHVEATNFSQALQENFCIHYKPVYWVVGMLLMETKLLNSLDAFLLTSRIIHLKN